MKAKLSSIAALTACLLFLASGAFASSIPVYSDPAGQGTQGWGGNLALTFNVNSPISVNSLGVFNASGTGFITGFIEVAIFNTGTGLMVTPMLTFHGQYTPSALGFDVFQSITPVVLGPGSYEVDAVGFSAADLNGNLNTGSSHGPFLNNLGGRITFTGAAWDGSTTLDDPLTCSGCQAPPLQWMQFDAGTFTVPESSDLAMLLGFGIFNFAAVLGVRRKLI